MRSRSRKTFSAANRRWARLRPAPRDTAVGIALTWIALVALSRLVLGVHWPTDVHAAACIGAALPLAISLGVESSRGR